MSLAALGREAYACRDCRLWQDGLGFPVDQEFTTWYLPTGSMTIGGASFPLTSEFVLCSTHEAKAEEIVK